MPGRNEPAAVARTAWVAELTAPSTVFLVPRGARRATNPARRFRANRADSAIREPFRHARRRVGRSPTAKR